MSKIYPNSLGHDKINLHVNGNSCNHFFQARKNLRQNSAIFQKSFANLLGLSPIQYKINLFFKIILLLRRHISEGFWQQMLVQSGLILYGFHNFMVFAKVGHGLHQEISKGT